jgi:hypothetical protein
MRITETDINRYRAVAREMRREQKDRAAVANWQERFDAARYAKSEGGAYAYR